jgi:dTDP-4-dehydrorhamnose 3,5-epimerase/epimerase EvaD
MIKTRALGIEGAHEFTPEVFRDDRGLFSSPLQEPALEEALGHPLFAVRDISHNVSARGVLRGIHYTATPPGRAKYVYVPHGRVLDYLVDLRVGSPTYGRFETNELSGDSARALYIPIGVGHAFLSLEEGSVVVYVMSSGYVPANERAVSTLDPDLGLPVPAGVVPRRSERDVAAPSLAEARAAGLLPDYEVARRAEDTLW